MAHKLGGYTPGPAEADHVSGEHRFARRHVPSPQAAGARLRPPNDELVGNAPATRRIPSASLTISSALRRSQAALEQLDDDKRANFVMAEEMPGETVVAIAAGLGIPVDTAYSRLREARSCSRRPWRRSPAARPRTSQRACNGHSHDQALHTRAARALAAVGRPDAVANACAISCSPDAMPA